MRFGLMAKFSIISAIVLLFTINTRIITFVTGVSYSLINFHNDSKWHSDLSLLSSSYSTESTHAS